MLTSFTCQYFFFLNTFIYVWLDLHCRLGFSLAAVSGSSLVAVCGLLAVASLVLEHWLQGLRASAAATPGLESSGSTLGAHGLSCFLARGILLDEGSNPCFLYWQVNSLPLSHQQSSTCQYFLMIYECSDVTLDLTVLSLLYFLTICYPKSSLTLNADVYISDNQLVLYEGM